MRKLFVVSLCLLIAGSAVALPSYYGVRGLNRILDARTIGQGGISFGLVTRYGVSNDDYPDLRFAPPQAYPDMDTTLNVTDKEHYADAYFTVCYGLADWFEIGARLSYVINYYERDTIQPRGQFAGKWDGAHGLGDALLGYKLGFAPIKDSRLFWLGMFNWFAFAPSSNETIMSEDYCGVWFDNQPMLEMRRPMLSTGHTSYGFTGLISLDFIDIMPDAPLRFHTNVGYSKFKQTFNFQDYRVTYESDEIVFSDTTQVNILVEDNVLDIGFGLEFPTQFAIIFTEYSLKEFTDRDDARNSIAYFTPGIRFITRSGAMMDITFDIGLTDFNPTYQDLGHSLYQQGAVDDEDRIQRSPFPNGGSNDWAIGINMAFSSDLIQEEVKTTGTVSGMITDAETGEAVSATISFPGTTILPVYSDSETGFYTVVVPEGSIPFTVNADGYLPASATVVIEGGQTLVKDYILQPSLGGRVVGTITDLETGDPVIATISIPDMEEEISVVTNADGVYEIGIPAGTWTIKIEAEDYLTHTDHVVVQANEAVVANFALRPALVEGMVMRFSNIYFDVGSANLKPESFSILDGVVSTLLENPDAKVQIAGHTDSDGSTSYNQTLSEQRAMSVYNYLVNHGVSSRNLTTIGFGESQPYVPNTSAANKAQNRRIEFTVLSVGL